MKLNMIFYFVIGENIIILLIVVVLIISFSIVFIRHIFQKEIFCYRVLCYRVSKDNLTNSSLVLFDFSKNHLVSIIYVSRTQSDINFGDIKLSC